MSGRTTYIQPGHLAEALRYRPRQGWGEQRDPRVKPIYFSRHARRRLRRHGIAQEQVEAALRAPDSTEPSVKGRTNALKSIGGRVLRVTFLEEPERIIVVTVTPRRHF